VRTDVSDWLDRRTYAGAGYDVAGLLAVKRRQGTTVSVVLPALDEERTVGAIVSSIRRELVEGAPLVDEVVVADSGVDRPHGGYCPIGRCAGDHR
jgi:glucosyl-3-phosphoglycerate synthase